MIILGSYQQGGVPLIECAGSGLEKATKKGSTDLILAIVRNDTGCVGKFAFFLRVRHLGVFVVGHLVGDRQRTMMPERHMSSRWHGCQGLLPLPFPVDLGHLADLLGISPRIAPKSSHIAPYRP